MDKDALLKSIAETGYNVGFGARKTFATFDLVEKGPGWVGFISFAIGLFALFTDELAAKVPSAILLMAGVAALYMGFYRSSDYEATAKHLLRLHNQLKNLYRSVQGGEDPTAAKPQLEAIEAEYYKITVSKQILLSDWYAHYKFFGQTQTGWMNEQLNFRFWKDMVPFSAKVLLSAIGIVLAAWLVILFFSVTAQFPPHFWGK